ncbi:uncharacterized protein [Primulina eburnea]|uniref:uncharacterized protein n=1 Tax=Primulina eburnea TaxID=1245227 RepID=UPI003C6CBC25
MKILKGYVRNRNRPEGCIAECYIAEEAIEFCSDYLSSVHTIGIPSDYLSIHSSIPYVSKNTQDRTGKLERLNHNASVIADRLSGASVDQLVFVPYNIGFHWILVVIEPYKEVIYLLDSLYHRIRDEDWKYVAEMALRLFNSNKGRKGKKNALWEVVKAPRQTDAKQCGYYVMRFMRQIIEEISTIERDSLRSIFTKSEYSREEIDEVRSELAECIQDHIYE